jgi:hypothetical protein
MAILNKTGITNGGTIQSEHVTRTIDALTGGSTDTIVATGSFSGSFKGNGSELTGVSAGFPFTGSAQITGSLEVSGSITVYGADINLYHNEDTGYPSKLQFKESVNFSTASIYITPDDGFLVIGHSGGNYGITIGQPASNTPVACVGKDPFGTWTSDATLAVSGSVKCLTVLTIQPRHPLPNNAATGSFAVSASIPPIPYFWDGSNWNALY